MKILIYGAGVIGCTYGWQLAKAGCDITLLVRENKRQAIEEKGMAICCADFRNAKKVIGNIVFRPKVTDSLENDNDFDYIIVTTNTLHLNEVLPVLKQSAGKAHIIFFQNVWFNDIDIINEYLSPGQYFFGFPFMAGGGRDEEKINTIISGSKYSKTMLGEVNGITTPRIQKIADALEKAGMKPFISDRIITWLVPHYAFIAAFSAGIIGVGGNMNDFIKDTKGVKEAIKAVREGFRICSAMGINPKDEEVNKLYYLPLFICTPIVKHIFGDKAMQAMFDGYVKNSVDEVKDMIYNIIKYGIRQNVQTPYLKSLQEKIV